MPPRREKKQGSTMGEVVTHEYTINMHKRLQGIGFNYKAPRAVKEIKKFAEKQMGTRHQAEQGHLGTGREWRVLQVGPWMA
jgi:hypothetical protein